MTKVIDFADDDVVVTAIMDFMGAALETRQRVGEQRHAVWRYLMSDIFE